MKRAACMYRGNLGEGAGMRIFRILIVLTGVAAFLPSPPEDSGQAAVQAGNPPVSGMLSSATLALGDIVSFCSRQPAVCQTAGYMADRLEAKAKYGVRLLYEWASESATEPGMPIPGQAEAADPIATGSVKTAMVRVAENSAQSTLRLDDLIPEWRGPPPKKKG